MRYILISEYKLHDFTKTVEKFLKEGWELQGGASISNWIEETPGGGWAVKSEYCQAMTKKA